MGINSHILPGDMLVVNDGAQLYTIHPDEIHPASDALNLWEDDDRLVANLKENDVCLVLAVAPAGSARYGHAFFVMTQPRIWFGWIVNHVARGFVTQREPSLNLMGRTFMLNAASYESWCRLHGSST